MSHAHTNGLDYWRLTLRPYALAGYDRGVVDEVEVTLFAGDNGAEVHLPRPSAAWVAASSLLPPLDADHEDRDPEATRGVRWLMKVGQDRMELTT